MTCNCSRAWARAAGGSWPKLHHPKCPFATDHRCRGCGEVIVGDWWHLGTAKLHARCVGAFIHVGAV